MPGLTEVFGMEAHWMRCVECGVPFQVPTYVYEWACYHKKALYCPYGHRNTGLLRTDQTLERKDQRIRYLKSELTATENKLRAARGQITKLKGGRKCR